MVDLPVSDLEEVLSYFEEFHLDLNAYQEVPEYAEMLSAEVRASSRSLTYYLRLFGMTDLAESVADIDANSTNIIERIESLRGHVLPEARRLLARGEEPVFQVRRRDLIAAIEAQRAVMVAVATGGPRIDSVNPEYVERRDLIREGLVERGCEDPNPFSDLWEWYGRWSADLGTYKARRQFVSDLYQPILQQLRSGSAPARVETETGWERVDRGYAKVRRALASAAEEEDFQSVGFFGRELLISLAQAVYEPEKHRQYLDLDPSPTDAAKMLEGFVGAELQGGSNEGVRRHAKASLSLANDLTHRRTATFREAALCSEAVASVVNIVAIVSGRRDPGRVADATTANSR